ncbi:MAG TPA: NADP-dependent phosphogluconate dehydrogenase [Phycisphaerae bacterium]|nr:NADP-dependent phosphogluconate dehydrogenase [Phycisphaerae bacterium]HOJ75768.1 NADP-dependent phosphogluconate dehydrogenase [Phycisphaerae bacterium]HOM51435.1 NADP-dependent phosphogluconate dehydrogenase [Phycisphaerae bacterium]HON68735.1 NADP-dependent phosphogluconate dehydrogenase [Phycisphaerae bacterium]HOQ87634.1 NADP-dependent phosphogluconate dehydrogenase [Phycisphaerae bacterium]
MGKQQFGLIGLAVMGENLALNIESRGYSMAVFNRTWEKTEAFINGRAKGKNFQAAKTLPEFVSLLEKPRKIMLMVKAGKPVDEFIDQLIPLLDKGDLIIDGGNSHFPDTIRRNKYLADKGLMFIGTGVSGGEEGALKGPSIMPGGQKEAYEYVAPIFKAISAKVDGEPCCTYIGPDGAGHYVKMVHNGIEYGDMQLICEAYSIMSGVLGLSAKELHEVFKEWNSGDLNSYLIEITRDIFAKTDPETGKPMVDVILDRAGQKGTGIWTSQSALDLGVPAPTIAEAVFARAISAIKTERVAASKELTGPTATFKGDKKEFINAIRDALYASKVCSYAQGFQLMRAAAEQYKWPLNYGEIAMIWRGGCIIRAHFLNRIKEAYDRNPQLANLLLDPYFKDIITRTQANWRRVVITAAELGVPTPAFSSALAYYDSYRSERLPANLLQAQRDYFGAHTYERVDKPGSFHTEWI